MYLFAVCTQQDYQMSAPHALPFTLYLHSSVWWQNLWGKDQ
jgi:hypothetical protein